VAPAKSGLSEVPEVSSFPFGLTQVVFEEIQRPIRVIVAGLFRSLCFTHAR